MAGPACCGYPALPDIVNPAEAVTPGWLTGAGICIAAMCGTLDAAACGAARDDAAAAEDVEDADGVRACLCCRLARELPTGGDPDGESVGGAWGSMGHDLQRTQKRCERTPAERRVGALTVLETTRGACNAPARGEYGKPRGCR